VCVFLNLRLRILFADLLIQEGFYDYEALPGREFSDTSPNYPFITNTNRFSDGVTSTSAFSTTSPRFPYYHGSTAVVENRFIHYSLYAENAASQGVAMIGAGDSEKETARVKFLQNHTDVDLNTLPPPTKTFTVYAAIKWNPSDFAIQEGEYYNITVFGNQTGYGSQMWNDGGIRVSAEGYSSYFDAVSNCYVALGRCRPHLKKQRRIPTGNWMALGCAIGEFVRPLTEVEPGRESSYRWMPIDESQLIPTLFNVGQHVSFRADYSGQLICFANDAHTTYWNNYGQIEVTVTRTSWPPLLMNEVVYYDHLLPSCDSAQVVYVNKGNNTYSTGKIRCNPKGGGSGWSQKDIESSAGSYSSGAPKKDFADLPADALSDDSIVD
jgi:hypothetical protein